MSKKALVGLLSLVVSALSNAPVHAMVLSPYVYCAEILGQVQDQEIRNVILRNIEAYYLGANFPDVGYLGKYLGQASSGKAYGEGTHWDEFLDAYKRALFKLYRHPMTENPMAFLLSWAFATHRVSDDIWHYDGNLVRINLRPVISQHPRSVTMGLFLDLQTWKDYHGLTLIKWQTRE